ncbi:MAG: 1,4-alpha-glucan branching protein GlgB [Deltaproteobacteria bacterium]
MKGTLSTKEINSIINADSRDPFAILGMHQIIIKQPKAEAKIDKNAKAEVKAANKESIDTSTKKIVVRAFIPNVKEISVVDADNNTKKYKMDEIAKEGLYEVVIPNRKVFFKYLLEIKYDNGYEELVRDTYSFWKVFSEYDLYLYNEGNHHKIYETMGAHICEIDGVKGVYFSVWAPTAKRVSVVGDFNHWDGRINQMRSLGSSGVWEIFIPDIKQGEIYKYEIKTQRGDIILKADPYAFYAELKPKTASIIYNVDNYVWNDREWIEKRERSNNFEQPVSIYEVHLGSWKKKTEDEESYYSYRELADELVSYVKEMGYTHIELLPIMEHPFDGSWGYQLTGYYAATSRHGTPEDFMYFVDVCHQNNIGVLVDWVPAHFPKDAFGLARFDGTALYEHEHPMQGEHPDWGTLIFNFGRNEVRNFLVSNAVFWFDKYHIDGLRVDAVASMLYLDYGKKDGEWICNKWGGRENIEAIEFLRQMNTAVYKYFPGIMMIAEESTSWAMVCKPPHVGGLGFSYKWNMGWMNDFLRYMSKDPIYRKYHHNNITFSICYAFSENFTLVLSHDEVVHGKCSMLNKMPGDYWQKFANLRTAYGFMYGHPGKKLLFMGGEFGQFIEWDYHKGLDWHLLGYEKHKKMQDYVRDLNKLYQSEKCLWELDFSGDGFEWIDCHDADHGVISFVRKAKDWKDMLVFVCNFTPVVYNGYRIGVPLQGYYKEIMNSDAEIYGGSGQGNSGGINSQEYQWQGRPYSLELTIPPLGVLVLKPEVK